MMQEKNKNNNDLQLLFRLPIKGKDQIKRVYDINGTSPTITAVQGGGQEPKILVQVQENDE